MVSSHYLRIIQPFFAKRWPLYVLGIVTLIVADILQLLIPRYIGFAVDALLENRANTHTYLAYLIGISILIAILRYVYRECIMGTTRRLESWLREKIFSHALRVSLSFYDENGPGKVMALTTNDLSAVRVAIGFGTMLFIDAAIMGFASLIVMAELISWQLTVWAVLPLPVILAAATWMGKSVHIRFREVQEKFSFLTEFTQEVFAGAKIIKGFAAEKHVVQRFSSANEANVNANMNLARLQAAYTPVTHIAPLACYALSLYWGGTLIMEGSITIGDFAAFTGYLGLIIWPVMGLGYLINTVQRGAASLLRIGQFLEQPLYETDIKAKEIITQPPSVVLSHLTFQYPNAAVPSLYNISCTIPAGSMVGIVGSAGAGKSTLLKLLLRLYDPAHGSIFISGREIHTIGFIELRESIGYVPQDSFLFSRTIGQNIAFSSDWSRAEIEHAARLAAVREAIDEKPLGFAEVLGEKGKRLSGGQQQRVAIARAIIKEAPLLLLDDVFAALDYRTQAELLANMKQVVAGRTVLVVSQRVAAVKEADSILVMDKGRIIEQGTHEELVTKKGLYYELYKQQLDNGDE